MSIKNIIKKVLLEETEQNQWVEVNPQDYLDLLKYVDGNGAMISKLPQYKNKKIVINGDLKINSNDVKNIDSIDYVQGNLDISYSGIEHFDKSKVKGSFYNYNSKMFYEEEKKKLQKKYDYLESLRQEDSWDVKNEEDVSERTEALYQHLKSEGHLGEDEDKYFIYPLNYGRTKMYEWLGENIFQSEWEVYRNDELDDAAYDYVTNLIDDVGLDAFRDWIYEQNLDKDAVRQFYREYYEELVYDDPEDYGVKKQLSSEQIKFKEVFQKKLNNLYNKLQQATTEEEKQSIEDNINNTKELIQDIDDNPEGGYDEDDIDDALTNLAEDRLDNFFEDIKNFGFEKDFILDYIDLKGVTEDVVRHDGYGALLNSYDGSDEEYEINGTTYHVMRQN